MPTPPLSPDLAREAVEACRRAGSISQGARLLGISRGAMSNRIDAAVRQGLIAREAVADQRFNPSRPPEDAARHMEAIGGDPAQVADGWTMHYDDDGRKLGSYRFKVEQAESIDDTLAEKLAAYLDRAPAYAPIPPPSREFVANAIDVLPIFDAHIGMYAYHREGGATWNVDEAQRLIPGAASMLMAHEPRPDRCLLVFGGDWRHFERPDAVTQYSGHLLSADTRIAKVQRTAVQLKVALCDMALVHYRHVEVIDAEGNHDPVSVHADREWLKLVYRAEPRLTVIDRNDLPFYWRRYGRVFLGFHHGDLYPIKTQRDRLRLALRMADDCSEDWTAARELRAIHSGHLHHSMAGWCDESGVWFEQHRTMAPRDGHAARRYARSQRGLTRITYDGDVGEIDRASVPPPLVRRMLAA